MTQLTAFFIKPPLSLLSGALESEVKWVKLLASMTYVIERGATVSAA